MRFVTSSQSVLALFGVVLILDIGCGSTPPKIGAVPFAPQPPPKSEFPSGALLLERLEATNACLTTLEVRSGRTNIFADQRNPVGTMLIVGLPSSLRLDVPDPVSGTIGRTVTIDGRTFAYTNISAAIFVTGHSDGCTGGPYIKLSLPPTMISRILMGRSPSASTQRRLLLRWDNDHYVLTSITGDDESEELDVVPRAEDWDKPWQMQRLRLRRVTVIRKHAKVFEVAYAAFRPVPMGSPNPLPPGSLPPVLPPLPSGPQCKDAESPTILRIIAGHADIVFEYDEFVGNPYLDNGIYRQDPPMAFTRVECAGSEQQ